jgi:hypothetical protein
MDWMDANQTCGSSLLGTYSPRAIAMVRFLYLSLEAIPITNVSMILNSYLSKSDQPLTRNHSAKWLRPDIRKT